MARKVKAGSFEQSLEKLEKIVGQMEDGGISLDEAVKLYEEGIGLSLACGKLLKETEQKVKILKETAEGLFEEEIFDLNGEEE